MPRSQAAGGKRREQGIPNLLSCFELVDIQGKSLKGGFDSVCLTVSRYASRVLFDSNWFTRVVREPPESTNGWHLSESESCILRAVFGKAGKVTRFLPF